MTDGLFSQVAETLHAGGNETLQKPPFFSCASETHEPFRLTEAPIQFAGADECFLYGTVRTTSWQFDRDRTDLHDVFSLVWAAVLRAFGLASPWLIDEPNGFGAPGELSARYLVLTQCPWRLSKNNFSTARESMNAWTAFGFHLLDAVFTWYRLEVINSSFLPALDDCKEPQWASAIRRYLNNPDDVIVSPRRYPFWIYLGSRRRGATILRMPRCRISALKSLLSPFHPEAVQGDDAVAILANGIANAVPNKAIRRALKLLSYTGDPCGSPLILPIDSHCIFLGDKTLVAIRVNCGREVFEREKEVFARRRSAEDRVFFADSTIEWKTPLDAGDFENACLDLLEREPGVVRAKPVGTVNDRDGGRDILIDWMVPSRHDLGAGTVPSADKADAISGGARRTIRIIAQVKSRSTTIGKRDVQDIRDTLENYQADGFLLIAHPRISAALVDHLGDLRNRTGLRTDWWEARDMETRLRRHPDIAKRYPRLLSFRSTGVS
jgi:hypothetical protein